MEDAINEDNRSAIAIVSDPAYQDFGAIGAPICERAMGTQQLRQ